MSRGDAVDPETLDGADTHDSDDPAPADEHDDVVRAVRVPTRKRAKRDPVGPATRKPKRSAAIPLSGSGDLSALPD
jgi:hypothetical protein